MPPDKKSNHREGGGSWVFAFGEHVRALRLPSELGDLRAAQPNQLTREARELPYPMPPDKKSNHREGGCFFWWGKLDSDQRSQ